MQRQLSLLVFVLLTVGVPAHASDWYPIDTGRSWSYSGTGGSTSSATIDAPAVFAGALAQPLHWNANVLEWMSQDGSGRVYEHGLTYPDGSYVVFDPPMLRMDSDLTPGHQWETTFDRITYNVVGAEVGRVTAHFVYEVKGVGAVNTYSTNGTSKESALRFAPTRPALCSSSPRTGRCWRRKVFRGER